MDFSMKSEMELAAEDLQARNLKLAENLFQKKDLDGLMSLYRKTLENQSALLRVCMMPADKNIAALFSSRSSGDVEAVRDIAIEAIALAKMVIAGSSKTRWVPDAD